MKILSPKEGIRKKIEKIIQAREEILFAYLFGSFIEEKKFNDIDLGIYLNENIKRENSTFYEIELSNQLEEILNIPVDIIRLNSTSDAIVYRATQGQLIKNSDDNFRINFITTSWKKYWDYKILIQEYLLEMKSGNR